MLFATAVVAAFLCSLVAGFLFAFAVVVMPGFKTLGDAEFLRAFRAIDGVIQTNQPLFLIVWLGSAIAVIAAASLAFGEADSATAWWLALTAAAYLAGVQAPTALINIPLNNQVQTLDLEAMDAEACHAARQAFEPTWTRWNTRRTVVACAVTASLLLLLPRLPV